MFQWLKKRKEGKKMARLARNAEFEQPLMGCIPPVKPIAQPDANPPLSCDDDVEGVIMPFDPPELKLRCVAGEHNGKEFTIADGTVIGRTPHYAISFSSTYIARKHAVFSYVNDEWVVSCMGSNGLTVNDRLIEPFSGCHPLKNNDVLNLLGEEFIVQLPES